MRRKQIVIAPRLCIVCKQFSHFLSFSPLLFYFYFRFFLPYGSFRNRFIFLSISLSLPHNFVHVLHKWHNVLPLCVNLHTSLCAFELQKEYYIVWHDLNAEARSIIFIQIINIAYKLCTLKCILRLLFWFIRSLNEKLLLFHIQTFGFDRRTRNKCKRMRTKTTTKTKKNMQKKTEQ